MHAQRSATDSISVRVLHSECHEGRHFMATPTVVVVVSVTMEIVSCICYVVYCILWTAVTAWSRDACHVQNVQSACGQLEYPREHLVTVAIS